MTVPEIFKEKSDKDETEVRKVLWTNFYQDLVETIETLINKIWEDEGRLGALNQLAIIVAIRKLIAKKEDPPVEALFKKTSLIPFMQAACINLTSFPQKNKFHDSTD